MGDDGNAGDGKGKRGSDLPLVLFEPSTADDLREGWQLHVVRRRTIHERAARNAQRAHYVVGSTAVVLATFAGSSLVSSWTADESNRTLALVGAVAVALAAMLTAFQTFLDLGSRAERHRQAANDYKVLLRQFEWISARRSQRSTDAGLSDDEYRAWIEQVQEELRTVDTKAPVVPLRLADSIEQRCKKSATTAAALARPCENAVEQRDAQV